MNVAKVKTPKQLVEETITKMEQFQSGNEVVKSMQSIVERLTSRSVDSWQIGELLEVIGQLSVLKVNLGVYVAKAMLEYNSAYAYRKFREADAYFGLKEQFKTVSDTDRQSKIETTDEYENQIAKNYQADLLKSFHDDVSALIITVQTILNHKKQEQRDTNNYNR